uniref:Uncharacterized protein n=1 Tax=Natrinema halophilum TaxID=1699371 RepID=A0A7D5KZF5_9EURY
MTGGDYGERIEREDDTPLFDAAVRVETPCRDSFDRILDSRKLDINSIVLYEIYIRRQNESL